MLSVLTVEQAGSNKSIEMFHSSPEGEDLYSLVKLFLQQHPSWIANPFISTRKAIVVEDNDGNYWVAQSQMYDSICFVEQEGE